MGIVVGVVGIAVLVLGALALWLRQAATSYRPEPLETVDLLGEPASRSAAGDSLDLVLWNIGFASLGREMDFRPDGGTHLRADSRGAVEAHLTGILRELHRFDADLFLIQEAAHASWLTHGVAVLESVRETLIGYQTAFTPTVRVHGIPLLGRLEVGKATFSRIAISRAVRHAMPTAPDLFGLTVQRFNTLETRIPVAGQTREWVIFNVHLAAFDDGPLRRAQLDALLSAMRREHARGNWVIAGGDWNYRLADTGFASTAPEAARFWVRDLPHDLARELDLEGWIWAIDASVPTCRTLEQPYVPGVNYTCVIDGALVSPGVEVADVATVDLGFADSDHQPVRLRVRGR